VAKNECQKVQAFGPCEMMACYIGFSVIEFIDENGGGPGVRLRKRHQKKS
jgi:hypothetical protein